MKFLYKTLRLALLPLLCTPALAQLPQLDWHKTFYSTGPAAAVSIAGIQTTLDGNIALFATFDGVVDIDPGPDTKIMDVSDGKAFFAKFDQRGNLLWAHQLAVEVAAWNLNPETGWIGYAARFNSSYDFDPGPKSHVLTPGTGSLALVRLDADGNFKNANDVRLGAAVSSLAMNAEGRMILAGNFTTATGFDPYGPSMVLTPRGRNDGYVAIYNTELNIQDVFAIGGSDDDRIQTLTVTADGFIAGGSFTNTANFHPGGGTEALSTTGAGGFLATYRLDQSGISLSRLVQMGASVEQVAVDPRSSRMTISGRIGDSVDTDPGAGVSMIYPVGTIDRYISHTRPDGSFGFGKCISVGFSMPDAKLSASPQGDAFYGGSFYQPIDVNDGQSNGTLSPAGIIDLFLCKFHEDGTLRYALSLGTPGAITSARITVAANGAILVAGLTSGLLDLDPGTGTTTINPDARNAAFLARYKDENTLGIAPLQALEPIRIHGTRRAAIIDFTACNKVDASIVVSDISGRSMIQTPHRTTDMRRIDLSDLPAGMYVVTVRNGTSKITGKIAVHD